MIPILMSAMPPRRIERIQMKICVIHGSNRKGNTDKTIELIKQTLDGQEDMTYTDFFLPKDLPHFCTGCFVCLRTGAYAGENCPHKEYTHPILKSMLEADGIILASPVYALAETAQIKSLLDHFACIYLNHRPNEEMFDKIAFVISTAAGLGTGRVMSTISRNMLFWGVKRTVKCKVNMWAKDWIQMDSQRRAKAEEAIRNQTLKFYKLTKNRRQLNTSISSKVLRYMFKRLINSYDDSEPDKIYWKNKGWI